MNKMEEVKLQLPADDDTDTPRWYGYFRKEDSGITVRPCTENTDLEQIEKNFPLRKFLKGPFKAVSRIKAKAVYEDLLNVDTDYLIMLEQQEVRKMLKAAGKLPPEEDDLLPF